MPNDGMCENFRDSFWADFSSSPSQVWFYFLLDFSTFFSSSLQTRYIGYRGMKKGKKGGKQALKERQAIQTARSGVLIWSNK